MTHGTFYILQHKIAGLKLFFPNTVDFRAWNMKSNIVNAPFFDDFYPGTVYGGGIGPRVNFGFYTMQTKLREVDDIFPADEYFLLCHV